MYEDYPGINMALILHYDQIYRHPNKRIIIKNKQIAFRFASLLAFKMIHDSSFKTLDMWKKVFILLAIRHNKNVTLKYFVLKKIYQELDANPTNPLLLRFLKATIWDIHQYKQKTTGYNIVNTKTIDPSAFSQILVTPSLHIQNTNDDCPVKLKRFTDIFSKTTDAIQESTLAISISGGVDSMVASYVMKQLCYKQNKLLILIHICYNNRKCCDKEIKLLIWWANKLNVPLYVRKIDEIKRNRNTSFRQVYEDITRRIRFSFYEYFNCPIILGHNQDDCYENVFSNLSKGIHFDNLFGMKPISYESNITIIRPMLTISKRDIIDFADNFNIPYLEDSTPNWSRRGMMRDTLIPSINKFDKNIMNGLDAFVKYTTMLSTHWKIHFINWVDVNVTLTYSVDETSKEVSTISIPRDKYFKENYTNIEFWIQLWFHKNIPTRPSNKSLTNLIKCIEGNKIIRITLNKSYNAIISSTHIIVQSQ
jgi:tRNA(Ile)-lysidine synthetase-like protein